VGWYAVTAAQEEQGIVPDVGGSLNPATEGYAISADGNIIHARATVRYRITDPVKFYLNHHSGRSLVTNLVDNALMFATAQFRVDDALTRNVSGFRETLLKRLSELVVAHDIGITLEPSDVQTMPPRQVRSDFDAVLTAELDRARTISEAQGYANRVINEAQGEATALINAGETERNRLVQAVSSEAQSFASLLPEYEKNPDFFRERLQLETLRRVLTNAQDVFALPLLQQDDQLRLHLNRAPQAPPAPQQP
jgi:membrane protease subunit HflK